MNKNGLIEQKMWQGPAGLYGESWDLFQNQLAYQSVLDPNKNPVRSGHGIPFFPRALDDQTPYLRKMNIRQTRYHFPGGQEYARFGFSGLNSSSAKPQASEPGYIVGPSISIPDDIWYAPL